MLTRLFNRINTLFDFTLPKEVCSDAWDQHEAEAFELDWVAGLELYTYDGFDTIEAFTKKHHGTCAIDGSCAIYTKEQMAINKAHREELALKESIRRAVYTTGSYAKGDSVEENQMRNVYHYNQKPKNKRCYYRNKA